MLSHYEPYSRFFLYTVLYAGPVFAFGIIVRPKNKTLTGIQGWLAWFALAQVVAAIAWAWLTWAAWSHGQDGLSAALAEFPRSEAVLLEQRLSWSAILLVQMVALYALFWKRRFFVNVVTWQACFLLALGAFEYMFALYILGAAPRDALDPIAIGQLLFNAVLLAIPVLYAHRSRRVANTMVR